MENNTNDTPALIRIESQPANAGHMEHHQAPEWETQRQAWSLSWHVENAWRCGEGENRCRCAGPGECGYAYIEEKAAGL